MTHVEPFSVVTPLAPMLNINIAERATYHVPGGELLTWTPFEPNAQLHFELYTWNYAPPEYVQFHYYNDWVADSGSKGMSLWEDPTHFLILKLDRTVKTPLSLPGYNAAKVRNQSTARRQVFTWK